MGHHDEEDRLGVSHARRGSSGHMSCGVWKDIKAERRWETYRLSKCRCEPNHDLCDGWVDWQQWTVLNTDKEECEKIKAANGPGDLDIPDNPFAQLEPEKGRIGPPVETISLTIQPSVVVDDAGPVVSNAPSQPQPSSPDPSTTTPSLDPEDDTFRLTQPLYRFEIAEAIKGDLIGKVEAINQPEGSLFYTGRLATEVVMTETSVSYVPEKLPYGLISIYLNGDKEGEVEVGANFNADEMPYFIEIGAFVGKEYSKKSLIWISALKPAPKAVVVESSSWGQIKSLMQMD